MNAKNQIIQIFRSNVQGKKPVKTLGEADGRQGHWLEEQFGIKANGDNAPDLLGFEMKNDTKSKTTFGDWQASKYIFDKKTGHISKAKFLEIFGAPNPAKDNRRSWSGKPFPNVRKWNDFGQRLLVADDGSVFAVYNFSKDKRPDKESIVPTDFRRGNIALAVWEAARLRELVENKFNIRGWFKCLKDESGTYVEIAFGSKISFQLFIDGVRSGAIYLDSGMYEGNSRPYQQWRADNSYWDSLIVERYR
jgi:hypothetical protein